MSAATAQLIIPWLLWAMAAGSIVGVIWQLLVISDAIEHMYNDKSED